MPPGTAGGKRKRAPEAATDNPTEQMSAAKPGKAPVEDAKANKKSAGGAQARKKEPTVTCAQWMSEERWVRAPLSESF